MSGENWEKDIGSKYLEIIISSAAYEENKEGKEGSKARWEDMASTLWLKVLILLTFEFNRIVHFSGPWRWANANLWPAIEQNVLLLQGDRHGRNRERARKTEKKKDKAISCSLSQMNPSDSPSSPPGNQWKWASEQWELPLTHASHIMKPRSTTKRDSVIPGTSTSLWMW